MFSKDNIVLFLILIVLIIYQVYISVKENWDSCYNYARAHDNFMRKFTKPKWIQKTDQIPQNSPYYDHSNYVPIGLLTNIKKQMNFTLFGEKNPSGGGVIFYYLYETPNGMFPFQFNKELFTGDFIDLQNNEFIVKLGDTTDAPYPFTFHPNVV